MMSDLKILICGDVNGNFRSLFSKVSSILKKKGSFEHLFCVGSFFGSCTDDWEDLKAGKIAVPLTTYVLGANELSHEQFYSSIDTIPNIVYLGKKGCFTGSSGLKIAYLSGIEQLSSKEQISRNKKSDNSIYFSRDDVSDLINSLESESVIDILLTSQWPKGVTKYAVSLDKESDAQKNSSALISHLTKVLKPRYHFCGLAGLHYERIPYRNHEILQESPVHVTRFVALSPVNNPLKQKWLYAFNITPASSLSHKQLIESLGPATVCPYDFAESLNLNKSENQFFYETSHHSKKHSRGEDQHQNKSKKFCSIDSSSCWFCLSNSDVEKQLIISIGSHCYITLAKGILVPEHVLIVPINHAISSVELTASVSEEVEKFKKSLARYFHDKGKDVVFFERNYSSPHLQIQAVPVPKQIKVHIESALFSVAKQYDLEFTELPDFTHIHELIPPKKPYFYFELMINKKSEARYLHIITQKFPLQFGRVVLASSEVLNVADRVDWRKCQDSKAREEEMAENMRKSFGPYDFT